ncbi:MAG: type I methionyl aminopeptidase [Phaeodactylibacter sp.]|nr:type I methionyl aminopeptidase [Phaeodactylibacter sp.]MCB9276111.1 type I methionyl aminopeptidase [Lewinellaceae bacterium]
MSITTPVELEGMQAIGQAVGMALKKMRDYASPGMTTRELDEYGGELLRQLGARSAPKLTYGFPGWTCISVNHQIAHGVPSDHIVLQEGDLVNIDVSAELDGFWADNGGSFVLGCDLHGHSALVDASRQILREALQLIRDSVRIAHVGRFIESEARKRGYTVIRNLVGHGVGRSLHEPPGSIPCYYDRFLRTRFREHAVVAVETFISTGARYAQETADGWTLDTGDSSYVAQHEHTILVTDGQPQILTEANGIWDA